jgi:hypothetical protein
MANAPIIVWQKFHPIPGGTIAVTKFQKTTADAETVENFPMTKDQNNSIVQLRMDNEAASTVTQTNDRNSFTLTGAKGALVTVVSIHNSPIVRDE